MQGDPQGYLQMGESVEGLTKPCGSCGDDNGSNINPMLELSELTGLSTDCQSAPGVVLAHCDDVTTRLDDIMTRHDDVTVQGRNIKNDATDLSSDVRTFSDDVKAQSSDMQTIPVSAEHRDTSNNQIDPGGPKTPSLLHNELKSTQDDITNMRPYIEVGVARTERALEPLQARWSHQGTSAASTALVASSSSPQPPDVQHAETDSDLSQSSSSVNSNDPNLDLLSGSIGANSDRSLGDVTPSTASLKDGSLGGSSELVTEKPVQLSVADLAQATGGSDAVGGSGGGGGEVAVICDLDEAEGDPPPRKSFAENMCCCCRAVQGAFLRCQEETPAMVTGTVLTILFCVTIIIIIPATDRVSHCQNPPPPTLPLYMLEKLLLLQFELHCYVLR